jgi:hypothetical protein
VTLRAETREELLSSGRAGRVDDVVRQSFSSAELMRPPRRHFQVHAACWMIWRRAVVSRRGTDRP